MHPFAGVCYPSWNCSGAATAGWCLKNQSIGGSLSCFYAYNTSTDVRVIKAANAMQLLSKTCMLTCVSTLSQLVVPAMPQALRQQARRS